jgi:nucleosome-remodeling factor subunit BPTF
LQLEFNTHIRLAPGVSATTKNVIQKKIMVKNADGTTKIIHQTITQTGVQSQSQQAVCQQTQPTTSQSAKQESQKVQIIRGPDGKVSVRGLMPGQQLIQTPDGKLHVLNSPQSE